MNKSNQKPPWLSGAEEILLHGLSLLGKDSDTNRRLAMICIDNSVEQMIKTYLGLPRRITNLKLTRKEFDEIKESFPNLLDALEKYCSEDKLDGLNLGEIEWYHRIRNGLYHNGQGLTVEKNKVQVYAELAKTLFYNLFGFNISFSKKDNDLEQLGQFMSGWINLERLLKELANKVKVENDDDKPGTVGAYFFGLRETMLGSRGLINEDIKKEIESLRYLRNAVIHGVKELSLLEELKAVPRVNSICSKLDKIKKKLK